jgi:hypothetical protein
MIAEDSFAQRELLLGLLCCLRMEIIMSLADTVGDFAHFSGVLLRQN